MPPFVAPDFEIPSGFETDQFRARMLTIHDVDRDYEAVIASASALTSLFPTWGGWPAGLTLEQNLIDIGWHQKEFQRRRSFAYTIVSHDEAKVLGCVYVEPAQRQGFDAEVYFWARESDLGEPADRALSNAVQPWMENEWPFERVAYPGRTIDWDTWASLPGKQG